MLVANKIKLCIRNFGEYNMYFKDVNTAEYILGDLNHLNTCTYILYDYVSFLH